MARVPGLLVLCVILALSSVSHADPFYKDKRWSREVPSTDGHVVLRSMTPTSAALVRLRFPSAFTSDALHLLSDKYLDFNQKQEWYLQSVTKYPVYAGRAPIEARIRDGVAKSSYYALMLYKVLRDRLPAGTVILDPYTIGTSETGVQKTLATSRQSHQLPAVLELDFSVMRNETFDYSLDTVRALTNTIGPFLSPNLIVSTSLEAWAGSSGVILSQPSRFTSLGEAMGNHKLGDIGPANCDCRARYRPGFTNNNASPMRYMSLGFDEIVPGRQAVTPREQRELVLPGGLYSRELKTGSSGTADQIEQYFEFVSNFVVISLNKVDPYLALEAEWREYLGQFDVNLGNEWPANGESERARLNLVKRLMDAERRFLTAESDGYYESEFSGAPGRAMRDQIAGEYQVLHQMEAFEKEQRKAANQVVLFQLLNLAAGHSIAATNPVLSNQILMNSLQSTVAANVSSADSESRATGELSSLFAPTVGTGITRNVEVATATVSDTDVISAATLEDFRRQLSGMYRKRFPTETVPMYVACKKAADMEKSAMSTYYRLSAQCQDGIPTAGVSVAWFESTTDAQAKGYEESVRSTTGSPFPGHGVIEGQFKDGSPLLMTDYSLGTNGNIEQQNGLVLYEGAPKEGAPKYVAIRAGKRVTDTEAVSKSVTSANIAALEAERQRLLQTLNAFIEFNKP